MTVDEVLERARSQIGIGTIYRMGGGKIVPCGIDCRDELGGADNSSFVCWSLGLRKYQGEQFWWLDSLNGGWYSSDGIWTDARGDGHRPEPAGPLTTGCFTELAFPEPGCVAVYPAESISQMPGPSIGHVGIVTEVKDHRRWKVVHCSFWNHQHSKDAIQETGPEIFLDRQALIFAWAASVKP